MMARIECDEKDLDPDVFGPGVTYEELEVKGDGGRNLHAITAE